MSLSIKNLLGCKTRSTKYLNQTVQTECDSHIQNYVSCSTAHHLNLYPRCSMHCGKGLFFSSQSSGTVADSVTASLVFSGCSWIEETFAGDAQIEKKSTNMAMEIYTLCRKYIFKWSIFSINMLIYRSDKKIVFVWTISIQQLQFIRLQHFPRGLPKRTPFLKPKCFHCCTRFRNGTVFC